MFTLICFFLLLISQIISAQNSKCQCPKNEKPGQKSCNGCEPSCDNPNPEICTARFCNNCSCDCGEGLLRDKKTKKCVKKDQCPHKKN
ncbi:hypothetical protein niasHT_037626 [Heterodera trifolii]|uniref:Uncharacterized protein n=1 Tax=Heterodera trifolii TaxID=157864 RepID=A0ABD2IK45_9BILA